MKICLVLFVTLLGLLGQAKQSTEASVVISTRSSVQLPTGNSQLNHIFNTRTGHMADTPANRQKLLDLANGRVGKYLGPDQYGNRWYEQRTSAGQYWVSVRGNTIQNGGRNDVPRQYNSSTGLNQS